MTGEGYARTVSRSGFDLLNGKRPLLGRMDIELTERCNNRCIHCLINRPEQDQEALSREMDTVFILDLLKQASGLGCMTVRFTGGEPLLRPDFPELYLAARRLGMEVILFTNGRRITPDLARLFSRVPPGRVIEITVYGMHPESYERTAGAKGSYGEFRRGVDLLLAYQVPFVVKQALLPQNREEMSDFEAWAGTIPWMDKQPQYSMNFDLRARRDDQKKNERIAALRLSPGEIVAMLAKNSKYVSGMQKFCAQFLSPPGVHLFSCGVGYGTCVDAYGYAQVCMGLRHPGMVCDLHRHSLREGLTEVFPRFREWKAKNPEYIRRCAVCFLKGLCEQCPAKSWIESGTLDTPIPYLCDLAHVQARYLGLIGGEEQAWEVTDWRDRVEWFVSSEHRGSR